MILVLPAGGFCLPLTRNLVLHFVKNLSMFLLRGHDQCYALLFTLPTAPRHRSLAGSRCFRCVQYAVKLQRLFIVCFNAFSSLVDVAEPQFFAPSGGLKDVGGRGGILSRQ
jgi:hypothetical protein